MGVVIYFRVGLSENTLVKWRSFEYKEQDYWHNDPMVHQIVKDIDNCDYVDRTIYINKKGQMLESTELSEGARTLIALYKAPQYEYNADYLGDNCISWLLTINKMHDIHIATTRFLKFIGPAHSKEPVLDLTCVNTNTHFTTMYDFVTHLIATDLILDLH